MTKARLKALRQEVEDIKDGGFTASIRPKQDRHGGKVFELYIAQGAVILHSQRFNTRYPGWATASLWNHAHKQSISF
jgi:hypothetical protein